MNQFQINNDLVVFKFNNIEIPFNLSSGPDNIMVEVTKMAKAYGKRINDWKNLPSTKRFLSKLLSIDTRFSSINDLIYSEKSGVEGQRGGGCTWMHVLVLIEFARWLDEEFAIWCNKMIIEIIRQRYQVELNQKDNTINNQNLLISQLQQDNQNLQNQISYFKPQLDYYNQVLQNPEPLYSTKQLVKQLGIKVSYKKFTKMMLDFGLVYKDTDNQIYVAAPYSKNRYRVATTKLCPDGKYRSVNKWTEAGKQWIYSLAIDWKLI